MSGLRVEDAVSEPFRELGNNRVAVAADGCTHPAGKPIRCSAYSTEGRPPISSGIEPP
jgi:hypothetical protein